MPSSWMQKSKTLIRPSIVQDNSHMLLSSKHISPDSLYSMDFQNKLILAPMVRISTLPIRLLSLDYGADLVYCEEIIDFKLLQCKRVENATLDTVDYIWKDNSVVFRTCAKESGKLVFQIGTADPDRALKVARFVEQDIDAIDVNMGCPKEFSVKGGMGAALLQRPDKVKQILTTLVNGLSIPVTCKIRILPTLKETLAFVKMVAATGVVAIAVHGRLRDERSRNPNHDDVIKIIAQSVDIPVIANGGSNEIKCFEDIGQFKARTGAQSVMLARVAEWNPSIFRPAGKLPLDDVIVAFLKYAVQYESYASNVKYCVQNMMHEILETPRGKAMQASVTVREICDLFGLASFYDDVTSSHKATDPQLQVTEDVQCRLLPDGSSVYEMAFKYNRKWYLEHLTPKMVLYELALKDSKPPPVYDTKMDSKDRTYESVLTYDAKKYSTSIRDKSKKAVEQAAAAICLRVLGIHDGRRNLGSRTNAWDNLKPAKSQCTSTGDHVTSSDSHCPNTLGKEMDSNIAGVSPKRSNGKSVERKHCESEAPSAEREERLSTSRQEDVHLCQTSKLPLKRKLSTDNDASREGLPHLSGSTLDSPVDVKPSS